MKQLIIDVREPGEYEQGHIEGAINLPSSNLDPNSKALSEIPKDTPLVLYCMSGGRAGASVKVLERFGYTNVTNGINMQQVQSDLNNQK